LYRPDHHEYQLDLVVCVTRIADYLAEAVGQPKDLQAWIRNSNLAPDWLRIGTDIVGGAVPPNFNMTFSLAGETVPEAALVCHSDNDKPKRLGREHRA